MKPAAIHQLSVSAAYGDAIGNEAIQIRDALRRAGHESEIFVEMFDPRMTFDVRPLQEYAEFAKPENLVLLHYSMGSAGAQVAHEIDDLIVLIYHNITPAEWFVPYAIDVARLCAAGRLQLAALRDRVALALGDSEYNRQELADLGFDPTGVLPLLLDLESLDAPTDRMVPRLVDADSPTWLFVGRVVPNKCFEDLIRAFVYYQRYVDDHAQLLIVGDHGSFTTYYHTLQRLIGDLLSTRIRFLGHVSDEELRTYYRLADIFVCLSEHEGFCVPLFEAIHRDIPVIAFSAAAIPYSTDGGVLLLEDKDPAFVAETVACILSDRELRQRLLARQRRALELVDKGRVLDALFTHLRGIGIEV